MLALHAQRRRRRDAQRFGLQPLIMTDRRSLSRHGSLIVLMFLLLLVGTAGPQWGRDYAPTAPVRDVVVLLDVSRTMFAESPSRLERARQGLRHLADQWQQQPGYRVALVAFAARPVVVCPLTRDLSYFRDAIDNIDTVLSRADLRPVAGSGKSGTRLGAALHAAVDLLDPKYRGFQEILLISDGDDPAGDSEWRDGITPARERQVPVHVVGVGDPERASPVPVRPGSADFLLDDRDRPIDSKLDSVPLQAIAAATNGSLTLAPGLVTLALDQRRHQGRHDDEVNLPVLRQRYAWFLLPALALLIGDLVGASQTRRRAPTRRARRNNLLLAGLAFLILSAVPVDDPEICTRRGNEAFEAGQFATALEWYARAEERTTDPGLVARNLAAAYGRLGSWGDAELHYRRCLDDATGLRRARTLYDLATCLLHRSRTTDVAMLAEAMRLLDECARHVDADPALREDATHNRALAARLWAEAVKSAPPGQDTKPSTNDNRSSSRRPGDRGSPDTPATSGTPQRTGSEPDKTSDPRNQRPIATDEPNPGAGNLSPIPDVGELAPLSAADAAAHLQAAVNRIRLDQAKSRVAAPRTRAQNALDR
jgi:Ca-activated chloride channel family protein